MDSQGFESRQGKEILFSPKEKSFVQCVPGFFPGSLNGRGVRMTTDLHQVPWLRMRGAKPLPPPLCFSMACSGTNLPFSHLLLLQLLLISCSFCGSKLTVSSASPEQIYCKSAYHKEEQI